MGSVRRNDGVRPGVPRLGYLLGEALVALQADLAAKRDGCGICSSSLHARRGSASGAAHWGRSRDRDVPAGSTRSGALPIRSARENVVR